ncbi:hypothetical protein MJO29_014423 [Puccinia striiformis f. sp. tritici]|nr:hypothetical protein MJO29_014423 [Puccinia striiformis f. sp. tritici]
MSSNSDSLDDKSSNSFKKLTTSNWVSWKSLFMLHLKSQCLKCLFDNEWVEKDENKDKLVRRNCKALKLLYNTVHKDLHNNILANDTLTVQQSSRDYYSRFLVFDTGATQSCVINLKLLTDVQPLTNHYMNMFLSPIEATHVGTLKIGTYFINPVYHVPNGCANILLASQLIDHGLKPHFKMDQFLLKGGDKIVATFPHIGRLFLAPISDYICVVNRKIPENFDWHYALGHALDKYVYLFCQQNNASSALSTKAINCEICTKAKIHQTAHSQKSPSSTTSFHRLHTDVLQITLISKFGYRCILVIVDDASCFNRIYLLKSKSESESRLLSFFEEIKNKLQQMPAYLHSNCGGEFSSLNFLDKLKEYRISIEQGPADSPQTNGVAERFNGVILKKIKCMLLQSKIPQSMWHEAACHASAILNILPHLLLNWHSPTSVLVKQNSSIKPDRTGMPLIPFGARVVVHRPELLKVLPKGVDLLFLGFVLNLDAAWFYDCLVHQVIVSRDYVVPNIEVDAGSSVVKKHVNSLPTKVQHCTNSRSKSYARLPGGLSSSTSSDSSGDESSESNKHVADAEKILKAFNMETSNAVKTPLPTNVLHQVDLESEPFDASIMQKAMGYINYLAIHTRPCH